MEEQKDKVNEPVEKVEDKRYHDIPFETIAKAFEKNAGNYTLTAKALGIGRRTLEGWRDKYPELKAMLRDVEEGLIDLAESRLLQKINEGDTTCTIFFLKTKGKSRGYIEGQIINANISTNKAMSQEEAIDFIKSLENEF